MNESGVPKYRKRKIWLTRDVVAQLAASAHVRAHDAGAPHTAGLRTSPPCTFNLGDVVTVKA